MSPLLYLLSVLGVLGGLVALRDGRRNWRYAARYPGASGAPAGGVIVFCPVRGADPDLGTHAGSLLEQQHPDYRVVFIVDSDTDPAGPVLAGLTGAAPSEVFVAGRATACGQKVHNLATAVEAFHEAGEVFVFSDADAVFPANWLTELTHPLGGERTGASTGYRWYVAPQRPTRSASRTASLLRSAWNANVAGYLGPHAGNFAWGGSTAIRREVFDRARVLEHWSGAVSDDYALTRAIRSAGLEIVYVPTCLVPSYGTCGWRALLEFTTRQIRITRVYAPRIWTLGFASHALFSCAFLGLTARIGSGIAPPLLWVALYALAAIRADARIRAARRTINDGSLDRDAWFYRLAPPAVSFLYTWNMLASLASRRIRWKGIGYTLVAPDQTHVEPSGG